MRTIPIDPKLDSPFIDKMSKYNDGKEAGYGNELLVLSFNSKNFILVKDGLEYHSKTLKELQKNFQGFILRTKHWGEFTKI